MKFEKKGLTLGALGALLLCVAPAARAQDDNTIGNPQLRDFQLRPGQQQQQQQPQMPTIDPAPRTPVVVAPPPPATTAPQNAPPQQQQPLPAGQRTQAAPAAPVQRQAAPGRPLGQSEGQPQPRAQPPAPLPQAETPAPAEPQPAAVPTQPLSTAPAPQGETGFPWLYAVPAGAVLLIGLALFFRRRRRVQDETFEEKYIEAEAPVVVAPPAAPRPDPSLRPWLELTLKAERASATLTETVVNFELEIANTGKSEARNLRIDVKMFNAGAEQDKEIGAFFRTAGRESTKLNLPGIGPESVGVISAQVAMPRDEMRAMVLEEKYLFVPVIAVNALYDWGEGRTGQTSKSYVVGRELQQPSDKMGAFRVDQGPRIWRTVGQRQHSLARRI
jgi:MYXO-CTERM domain-containing protein